MTGSTVTSEDEGMHLYSGLLITASGEEGADEEEADEEGVDEEEADEEEADEEEAGEGETDERSSALAMASSEKQALVLT